MSSYFGTNLSSFSGPFGLKQTSSIATMDFGAADHALAQIIRGRFMHHFGSEDFDFDLYTERNVL
jgi:hypothetical protein